MPPVPGHSVRLRDGFELVTCIVEDASPLALEAARRGIDRLALAHAMPLALPTGRYNCHGLVFASRRGNVGIVGFDVDIDDVLSRDGFRRVPEGEAARVGDVIAYREPAVVAIALERLVPAQGAIEHTGFVSRVDRVGSVPVAWVWSAWGGLGEFEHPEHLCPYRGSREYWRLS